MTTTNTRPTCQSCPYWQQYNTGKKGECRRHAPRDMPGCENDWAVTQNTDWCGGHPQMPAYVAGLAGSSGGSRE